MLLRDVLTTLYAPLRSLSPKSTANYTFTIRALARFLEREPTLDDLDELTMARFLSWRAKERTLATTAKDRAQLRALHEFAARRKLCDHWPQYPPVRAPERVPEAWLTSQMERLLEAAATEPGEYEGIPACDWWPALIMVAYDTAERAQALVSIRWSCVGSGSILFLAESRKGKRRDVLREIGPDTQAALEKIRLNRAPEDLVFPWPMTYPYLFARLTKILKRAGLPHGRRDKFHRIRRTTASFFAAAGGSAQMLLDHASPVTTRRYLDPRIVCTQSAAATIPRLNRSEEGSESAT